MTDQPFFGLFSPFWAGFAAARSVDKPKKPWYIEHVINDPNKEPCFGEEEVSHMRFDALSILVLIPVIVRLCSRYDSVKSHAPERM